MTPEQEKILKEMHETVQSIQQLLKGYNGTEGLCANYEAHKKDDIIFRKEFYRFRTWVYILVAFAAGSGGVVGAGLGRWFSG
mgnify:CR=1 FL=1